MVLTSVIFLQCHEDFNIVILHDVCRCVKGNQVMQLLQVIQVSATAVVEVLTWRWSVSRCRHVAWNRPRGRDVMSTVRCSRYPVPACDDRPPHACRWNTDIRQPTRCTGRSCDRAGRSSDLSAAFNAHTTQSRDQIYLYNTDLRRVGDCRNIQRLIALRDMSRPNPRWLQKKQQLPLE